MQADIELSLTDPLIWPLVPQENRAAVATLWRLEARVSELCHSGKEPALRQIRLAWWRDALAALDRANMRVPDEPLLREIAETLASTLTGSQLADHADAWLTALGSGWSDSDVMAAGQSLFGMTATFWGTEVPPAAGHNYALIRTALLVDDGRIRDRLIAAATAIRPPGGAVRPLAVLDGLATGIARRHGGRSRVREQALILRMGLFGR